MKLKKKFHTLNIENRLYKLEVPIVGLTGGIATGKSSVSNILKKWNFPIIDADKNVKAIYASAEGFNFIQKEFPACIINQQINFPLLRETIFKNNDAKEIVETFIYKNLPAEFLRSYKDLGKPDFVIYDVPLLFEKSLDKLVDSNITVYAPLELQLSRIIKRDKTSADLAQKIISAQENIEDKKVKSHFVIDNTKTLSELKENVKEVLKQLFEPLPF